jgi:tetratricopeptide (TPR) repeat protein
VDANAYLAAVIDMERVGQLRSARRAYASASRRWPDNLLALGGLGNSAFALGDYAGAESAYRAALAIAPQQAGLWNNLAYALAKSGRREAALEAVQRAVDLDPGNANYRASRAELEQGQ